MLATSWESFDQILGVVFPRPLKSMTGSIKYVLTGMPKMQEIIHEMLCDEFFKFQDQIRRQSRKKTVSCWGTSRKYSSLKPINSMQIKHLNNDLKVSISMFPKQWRMMDLLKEEVGSQENAFHPMYHKRIKKLEEYKEEALECEALLIKKLFEFFQCSSQFYRRQRAKGLCQKHGPLSNTSCKELKDPFNMVEVRLFIFIIYMRFDTNFFLSLNYRTIQRPFLSHFLRLKNTFPAQHHLLLLSKPWTAERFLSIHKLKRFSRILLISPKKNSKKNFVFIFYLSSFTFFTLQNQTFNIYILFINLLLFILFASSINQNAKVQCS
ncbi:hypothetical protein VP01_3447g1 [Puccinia sorghi]|uniref:Uncharacterized protein n=1 Tax=Puccinia sorghi TaxID=27349 RepID=A0A0L6UW91_9BASI|nr:hypothetical protein VP01_3447g1 [Puccinia sorghi]